MDENCKSQHFKISNEDLNIIESFPISKKKNYTEAAIELFKK